MKYILRLSIAIIAVILLLDAMVLVFRGAMETWHAYHDLLFDPSVERPLLPALEAVDQFFLALVFFIMAIGLVQLFIGEMSWLKSVSFSWMKMDSFTTLKLLLWDTFLVTLLVFFVTRVILQPVLDWPDLVLPAAILMLTASSYLLKKGH